MRTQAQRKEEFLAKKQAMIERLEHVRNGLEDTQQTLRHRFYPSEQRFKEWATEVHASNPGRTINIREFMRDFCMEVAHGIKKHKEDLNYAHDVVHEWETWFQGLESEDLQVLEGQMEQEGVSLASIPTI